MTNNFSEQLPAGWLAFELSVLRRLSFRSVVNPLCGESDVEAYLKRWGVRVAANDPARWAWVRAVSRVENNSERLTQSDLDLLLEDVYVPGYRLRNPALARRFGETDAWWFDNLRANADKLDGDQKRAVALDLGITVGDYALSFDEETRELRRPLSRVFLSLNESLPAPYDNRQRNSCANKDARQFLSASQADLLFVRLPAPSAARDGRGSRTAWREEWVRGAADFWDDFETAQVDTLGARAGTKQQYLRLLEDLLRAGAHVKSWAVSHVDAGHFPAEELVETLRRFRKVDTVYTKDFSELTGARAVMITAG